MRFSALLPTRNGLKFLKHAVTSVLKQNDDQWELIISDNASSENIEGYVRSLNEPRIKYSRSEEFLSVTENWNRCLDLCSGEYVVMLGDDDILLKNYFQISRKLIEKFQQPDIIYSNAFLYAYPHVLPNYSKGLFQAFGSINAMPKHEAPFWLDFPTRLALVQQLLRFQPVYATNMQHALIHRPIIEKIKRDAKFFHSPYPDFYAMSALFMEAKRFLVYPKEMVVIGITPKSHGYYFFNNKEKEAVDFLNIQKEMSTISNIQSVLLPGLGLHTFWLGAMETLKKHFPFEQYNLKLDYQIYRQAQINYVLQNFLNGKDKFQEEFQRLMQRLTFFEKALNIFPQIIVHSDRNQLIKYLTFFEKLMLKFLTIPNLLQKKPPFLQIVRALKWMQRHSQRINSRPPMQMIYPIGSSMANPIEDRFANASEIFEQIEPMNLS